MKTTAKMSWELIEGVEIIRRLNPKVLTAGHALALTGGVLFRGYSESDLDIIAYPLGALDSDYQEVLRIFYREFPKSEMRVITQDRDPLGKLVFAMRMEDKRRIEIFFPSRTLKSRIDKVPEFKDGTDYL